jgi:alanyl-tRNA synthetase
MLGNFSFGDYFKDEAIRFGWQLVTGVWGLSPRVLAATVYEEDDEAYDLWRRVSGLPAERIHRCGKADNFWAMGDTGPCGPCSEIYVDRRPDLPPADWDEGTASGRYLEIWNLVFMQFDRGADGALVPLPNPSIDTGAGLERVAAVLQRVDSNYDTDLFQPVLRAAATLAATEYGRDQGGDVSLRVIADHLRAVAFLLADGVIAGNEGRGYVLRRLLRRAVRHGMRLGFTEPFLHRLVPVLGEVMGSAYPELAATRAATVASVEAEEEKFLSTVAAASRQVQDAIEEARRRGEATLGGEAIFRFYDTYGLPFDVVREIAEEERFAVDEAGFRRALEEQRERSREATAAKQGELSGLGQLFGGEVTTPTDFRGYAELEVAARVEALAGQEPGASGRGMRPVEELRQGDEGVMVVERTPFYAEGGGQVGDRGEAAWPGGAAEVVDTTKTPAGVHFHWLKVLRGRLAPGMEVTLRVDRELRRATQRNHTATHLLHAALRQVLGDGVRQAGSLVAPDRLRFDFTYSQPLTGEEKERIEGLVNEWILRATPTTIRGQRPLREALAAGAMALFGEKYGDQVRTVEVPEVSLELCGGCHVANTGEIGSLVIVGERGIASGVRRIEALTGKGALAWLQKRHLQLRGVESLIGEKDAEQEIRALREEIQGYQAELARLRLQAVASRGPAEDAEAVVAGVKLLAREVPPAPAGELRTMADALRARLGSGVVVLGARGEGKVSLVAAVTLDLAGRVSAGELVKRIAPLVGGSGGGRRDFAQAGGKDADRLPEALAAVPGALADLLS